MRKSNQNDKHIFRHYPPPKYGGVQSFFYDFIKQIDEDFILFTHKDANPGQIKQNIISLSFVPPPRKPNSGLKLYVSTIKTFLYFVKKRKILFKEGIHFGQIWPYGIAAFVLKKIYGVKYTIFLFGEEISQVVYKNSLKYQIIKWFYKKILLNSSNIQVSSSFVKENLNVLFNNNAPKYVQIFYNGIEPETFCRVSSKMPKNFLSKDGDVILFSISRHIERKGYSYLLDSVYGLEKTTKNWRLFIGGKGPETNNLKQKIARLGLNSKVILLGELSKEELHFCYDNSDIFILTNVMLDNGDADGCPIVFLEAACYNIPSLGGDVPGTKDAIINGKTGYIVDSKNPLDISKKLKLLVENPEERARMGKNARSYVAHNYKWENRIKKFRSINEKILN